ncbi:RNA polymerase sigma-70 factor (ECF subfamily) [Pedobacter cryoconitis]|uniref:RNA polymerase sigma-70 factor (ECF subfamily) n=1 Tax=Pedobacter cryoconitis TaxID=188932 RepID=A0A7W9DX93_9SPHI|nr:RNA polymerase sigma-70 factor [Pedobacter cryoconitis]MBB5634882.1 RNA polymerase sigma-70 factor (ECF subfamily) [Pedobacter cryoconitis]
MEKTYHVELTGTVIQTAAIQYDDTAFEHLFKAHYKALHIYVNTMIRDQEIAEEIVQNRFMKFWENRALLNIETSVKAYLYKCVYHDTMNFLKHEKVKARYQNYTIHTSQASEPASHRIELNELESRLHGAMEDLPEQCRLIFHMSRFEELKYREIAEQLGLSIKTVEGQMGKALRILRLKLVDFLALILLGIMFYKDFLK